MIEFQFFNGCPSAPLTLQNLKAVMLELGIADYHLKISVVPDIDTAKQLSFQGSPSIPANEIDILHTGLEPTGFSYGCRIYEFNGEQTGVIPVGFIRGKLKGY